MRLFWKLHEGRLGRTTKEYLRSLKRDGHRERMERLFASLRGSPRIILGTTEWRGPVEIPLSELTQGHGIVTGGTGSGKSMFTLLLIHKLIHEGMGFGLLDAKGELFERTLWLLSHYPELWDRVVIVDFSNREAITPYNILTPQGDDFDYFITSRTETLKELLPANDRISIRGTGILRNSITLLAELGYPLTWLDRLLSDASLRNRLVRKSKNHAVKWYFQKWFPQENSHSVGAIRGRITSLFASEGVRLSLGGDSSPDFRALQDNNRIVLINCAGKTIARGVRILLQGLVVSDLRQSILARQNKRPYHFFIDEAQNVFLTSQQQEDVAEILTTSRSFGSHCTLICQNLHTAVRSGDAEEILHANIRWSLTLRSTPKDAGFMRSALPVTGTLRKPSSLFQEKQYYNENEERRILHEDIAHLPDRHGYFWLKARSPGAIKIKTRYLRIPDNWQDRVDELRNNPAFGQRISRKDYERLLRSREPERRNIEDELERNYDG